MAQKAPEDKSYLRYGVVTGVLLAAAFVIYNLFGLLTNRTLALLPAILYVVLIIAIFFTVSPRLYRDGIIKLVPPRGKDKAKDVMDELGESLKKWLKRQLFAMLVVTILTATALGIMGIPMWLLLALIAGLLNFIPNFGPIIAMIPAVLVALSQSPSMALWVAGVYIAIQVVESNLITPLVQNKMLHIPPAMIIIAQMLIAPFSGGWGLVLATPLMVIVMVLVQELYVKRQGKEGDG